MYIKNLFRRNFIDLKKGNKNHCTLALSVSAAKTENMSTPVHYTIIQSASAYSWCGHQPHSAKSRLKLSKSDIIWTYSDFSSSLVISAQLKFHIDSVFTKERLFAVVVFCSLIRNNIIYFTQKARSKYLCNCSENTFHLQLWAFFNTTEVLIVLLH